jgi:hypothetical protein
MSLGAYYEISQGPIRGIGHYERPGAMERFMQPYDGLGVEPAQNAPLPDPTGAARIACNMAQLTWDEAKQQCTQVPSGGQQPMPPNVGALVVDCGRAGNVWDPISATCKYFPGPVADPSIITQCTAAGKADWDATTKTCKPKPTVLGMQIPTALLLVAGAGVLYYLATRKKS